MGCPESIDPGADPYEEFLTHLSRDRDRIYSYIYSLLPHHADAEDVFQRCSILLWRKFGQYDRRGRFLSWACGFAFHEVCNFLRTAGRDRLRFDAELVGRLAESRMETIDREDERLAALRRCLETLRGRERELIGRVYGGEGSIKELAETTGQAAKTLYNQLSQVRLKLFHCMRRRLAAQE
jgi:RNA polymerase sigma-70 factor